MSRTTCAALPSRARAIVRASRLPTGSNAQMIVGMPMLTRLFTVVLVGFCGCGGQSETAKPSVTPAPEIGAEPRAPEAAQPAASDTAPSTPAAAEAGKTEADQPKAGNGKTEADQAKAGKTEGPQRGTVVNANPSEKKSCASLKKDVCKVTLGCAWSTTKKCIDQ